MMDITISLNSQEYSALLRMANSEEKERYKVAEDLVRDGLIRARYYARDELKTIDKLTARLEEYEAAIEDFLAIMRKEDWARVVDNLKSITDRLKDEED